MDAHLGRPHLEVRATRTPAHRALRRRNPEALRDALAAVDSVALEHALPPRVATDVERIVVHQVAKALGVKP